MFEGRFSRLLFEVKCNFPPKLPKVLSRSDLFHLTLTINWLEEKLTHCILLTNAIGLRTLKWTIICY
jgi:hypothetical protein